MQLRGARWIRPLGLALACLLALPLPLLAELAIPVQGGRYDPTLLTGDDPVLAEIFATANDIGFRVGTWGGASRDYLLGRGAPPEFSDVDMVYDSRELWAAMKADGPVGFIKKTGRLVKGFWRVARVGGFKALTRYTYLDSRQGDGKSLTVSVVKMINSGAGTVNQVGLMSDGSVWDPTGGLADIENKVLRYRTPKPVALMMEELDDIKNPSPYDVLRMVRFKVQYPELAWADGTYETLQRIMQAYGPGTSYRADLKSYSEGFFGKLRKWTPDKLERPLAALRNNIGAQHRRDLVPYIRRGFEKLLKSTPDPAESLRLVRELGLDEMARDLGMGDYITELEGKAAGFSPAFGGYQPDDPAGEAPATDLLVKAQPAVLAGAAASQDAEARAALERVETQAYRHFLDAQERGDSAAATEHYRVYLRARAALGGTP